VVLFLGTWLGIPATLQEIVFKWSIGANVLLLGIYTGRSFADKVLFK
jgi:hypothetical protein